MVAFFDCRLNGVQCHGHTNVITLSSLWLSASVVFGGIVRSISLIKECIVRYVSEDINNEHGSHLFEGNWTSQPWLTALGELCVYWGGR